MSLEICVIAVQAGDFDMEVSLAGVDSTFDLIKATKVVRQLACAWWGGALVEEPLSSSRLTE
jgi:hypothetical protein